MQYAPYYPQFATAQYRYASFLRRVIAYLIDVVVVFVALAAVVAVLKATLDLELYEKRTSSSGFYVGITGWPVIVATLLYFVWLNGRGATIGKMALDIRVTNRDGGPPGLRRAVLRTLVLFAAMALEPLFALISRSAEELGGFKWWFISSGVGAGLSILFSILWFGDQLSMIWHEHKQTVHDQIGGTYVIRN
jgi:uncharacterized RDD family membrane protein YckC